LVRRRYGGKIDEAKRSCPVSRIAFIGMPGPKFRHLRFDRLGQQRPGSRSQHFSQRVPNLVRHRWILQRENGIVTHGVHSFVKRLMILVDDQEYAALSLQLIHNFRA
jgi:hypothetical protein